MGVRLIKKLYAIEQRIRALSLEEKYTIRPFAVGRKDCVCHEGDIMK